MRIAMVASEANPLCKSGGLADVVYSLSKELVKNGHEVMIILPFYSSIKAKIRDVTYIGEFKMNFAWRRTNLKLCTKTIDGIQYCLIENDTYFWRDNLYGYDDDAERFAYFTLGAREAMQILHFAPDIIHIHDWQPGMLPVLIKNQNRGDPIFANTKFVTTIHNPAFKGYMDRYYLGDYYLLPDELYDYGDVRFDGMVSSLKASIVFSEKITTVSPTHRGELLSEYFSQGFCGVLRLREGDFVGIVNGLDTDEFNPGKDDYIAASYGATKLGVGAGKKKCRAALMAECGFEDDGGPVFGLVSRLTFQKGIDLVLNQAEGIIERGGYVVILGSGEYELEEGFKYLAAKHPDRVYVYIGYSNKFAHQVYAGSDFFLMPSLFEPCGIGQMIALRYGTLPIARETGGLKDTIVHFDWNNVENATGFLFLDYSPHAFYLAIASAEEAYKEKKVYNKLCRNAMNVDNSWKNSTKEYEKLYQEILG